MLRILYVDFDSMPPKVGKKPVRKRVSSSIAVSKNDGKPRPRTMDWEQDANHHTGCE